MNVDEFQAAVDSGQELRDVLDDLEARSRSFGGALTTALKGAVLDGDSLAEVLQNIAYRFSSISLDVGLKPLTDQIGETISDVTGSLSSAVGFSRGAVVSQPTVFPVGDTVNVMGEAAGKTITPLSPGADSRPGVVTSGGQYSRPGVVISGGQAPVHITFNVTAADAQSFRRSEGQINAMLTRAVGRGRRGI